MMNAIHSYPLERYGDVIISENNVIMKSVRKKKFNFSPTLRLDITNNYEALFTFEYDD